jgi:tetratricopeptide (TPR) repeat protein
MASPVWSHHPIQTASPEAQREFDRGLTLVYAFDYDAAISAFERAARLDPRASMPHWGIALALGPNLNDLRMERRMASAHAAAHQALERDYASALATRYTAAPTVALSKLSLVYANAMRDLAARYPDDVDAATLFAESLMLSGTGPLWLRTGEAGDGALEAMRALEAALAREPRHIGANHYYIHLLEESPAPERALPSAERLDGYQGSNGHLLHMPSHIYVRLGDYRRAVASNLKAVSVDRAHAEHQGPVAGYSTLKDHSREFLAAAACLTGQSSLARRTLTNLFVLLRFNQWEGVLRYPQPVNPVALLEWRVARVLALVGTGRLAAAETVRAEFAAAERRLPGGALWWSDPVAKFVPMARHEMDARLSWARGERKHAIERWRQAVNAQDLLTPGEVPPWPWFHSIRESLGAALYLTGELEEAERVFRDDLTRYRGNPRSLYGLWRTLEQQGKAEAARVHGEFQAAWADADTELSMADL